jgi:predicted transposase YbfD/YdcC
MPLCLIDSLVGKCEGAGVARPVVELEDLGPLLAALEQVPDPRSAKGRHYPWIFLTAGTLLAVLCGSKSLAAAVQWISEAPEDLMELLGAGKRRRRMWVSTLSRPFSKIPADALDDALYAWLNTLHEVSEPLTREEEYCPALAIDGKTPRGARDDDGKTPYLLSALRHEDGTVAGQRQVGKKTNEIKAFIPLLKTIDISGMVITADQMHTQRGHAAFLKERGAYYLFTVGGNHPKLLFALMSLPWDGRRVAFRSRDVGHGRIETRRIKVYAAPKDLPFPDVTRVFRVERHFTDLDGKLLSYEVALGITSLPKRKATPAVIAGVLRGHWGIESLHFVRDGTYAEDASQVRTGSSPRVMATFRNVSISLLKLMGWENMAEATRHMMVRPYEAANLIGLT